MLLEVGVVKTPKCRFLSLVFVCPYISNFINSFKPNYFKDGDFCYFTYSKGYQNPKRKLGVTAHFLEITELQFGKKVPYITLFCILQLF